MDPDFDISKFVGAASAPVALVIATAVFLSNLTTRWWAISGIFRQLTGEYRVMDREGGHPELIKSDVRSSIFYPTAAITAVGDDGACIGNPILHPDRSF